MKYHFCKDRNQTTTQLQETWAARKRLEKLSEQEISLISRNVKSINTLSGMKFIK